MGGRDGAVENKRSKDDWRIERSIKIEWEGNECL